MYECEYECVCECECRCRSGEVNKYSIAAWRESPGSPWEVESSCSHARTIRSHIRSSPAQCRPVSGPKGPWFSAPPSLTLLGGRAALPGTGLLAVAFSSPES